jgi:hypothetical protein
MATCIAGGLRALILALGLLPLHGAAAEMGQQAGRSGVPAGPAEAARQAYLSILGEGWNTNSTEAARLESELVSDPQNVAARTRLISYYYQQMIAEPRARHILWLIENQPQAEVFGLASGLTHMSPGWAGLNSASDWDRARALWLRQTERFPNDAKVLFNAAQALPAEDSLRLIGRARALEPANSVWTVNLAMMYARAVREVFYARDPAGGARSFTGSRKYGSVRPMRLPSATLPLAETMMKELETSGDAELVGVTGELLVEEIHLIGRGGTETPEMASSAEFGRRLVERARSLDPANPRWQR